MNISPSVRHGAGAIWGRRSAPTRFAGQPSERPEKSDPPPSKNSPTGKVPGFVLAGLRLALGLMSLHVFSIGVQAYRDLQSAQNDFREATVEAREKLEEKNKPAFFEVCDGVLPEKATDSASLVRCETALKEKEAKFQELETFTGKAKVVYPAFTTIIAAGGLFGALRGVFRNPSASGADADKPE